MYKRQEEDFLAEKFGAEYADYKRVVPALFPWPRRGFPPASANEKPFDAKRAVSYTHLYHLRSEDVQPAWDHGHLEKELD